MLKQSNKEKTVSLWYHTPAPSLPSPLSEATLPSRPRSLSSNFPRAYGPPYSLTFGGTVSLTAFVSAVSLANEFSSRAYSFR